MVHGFAAPTRYAVRQVVDQEMQRASILRENAARQSRFRAGNPADVEDFLFDNKENSKTKLVTLPAIPVKKDFFGRVIKSEPKPLQETDGNKGESSKQDDAPEKGETKVWVTFNEGMSNAVRKPLTLDELLRGL